MRSFLRGGVLSGSGCLRAGRTAPSPPPSPRTTHLDHWASWAESLRAGSGGGMRRRRLRRGKCGPAPGSRPAGPRGQRRPSPRVSPSSASVRRSQDVWPPDCHRSGRAAGGAQVLDPAPHTSGEASRSSSVRCWVGASCCSLEYAWQRLAASGRWRGVGALGRCTGKTGLRRGGPRGDPARARLGQCRREACGRLSMRVAVVPTSQGHELQTGVRSGWSVSLLRLKDNWFCKQIFGGGLWPVTLNQGQALGGSVLYPHSRCSLEGPELLPKLPAELPEAPTREACHVVPPSWQTQPAQKAGTLGREGACVPSHSAFSSCHLCAPQPTADPPHCSLAPGPAHSTRGFFPHVGPSLTVPTP